MTFEALLTFAGILVGVLAIARPVQRHSLLLFASVWRVGVAIALSFVLLVCRDAPLGMKPPFGWPLDLVLFYLTVGAFLIPVLAALWSWLSWHRVKLSGSKLRHVENIFQVALREHEFDEVERIVRKNQQVLDQLPASAISILFHPTMVAALIESRSYIHLEMLADIKFLRSLDDRFGDVDSVVRELLRSNMSPLRSAVVKKYGGWENLKYTHAEQELMEKTFEKPEWYTLSNAHYPLVISAVEALRTGALDSEYNDVGLGYEEEQGVSKRSRCPIYLAEKTEMLALEAAIENKYEDDLYTSDLFDIFRAVQERSKFDRAVWESPLSHPEFPTPYAYLLYQINSDFRDLSEMAVQQSISESEVHRVEPPGRVAQDLARRWSLCIWNISDSKGQVSSEFRDEIIKWYLVFVLQLGWAPSELGVGNGTKGLDAWRDLFASELRVNFRGKANCLLVLEDTVASLDQGKRYVYDGSEWLKEKLFGSRATP